MSLRNGCGQIEGGLWGCIVVLSTFLIQTVAYGTSQSIGLYNIELLEEFEAGAAAVSLVGSINLGLFLGAGPLASILMTRWSCRQVALVGALLANIGIISMPFAPNLQFMYVFYGVVAGFGYCLVYGSSCVLSGLYFYKQRSCVSGVTTAGSGLGATLCPVIFHHLIELYGWRGSFFIVAGFNLHLFVFATLLRPVPKRLLKSLEKLEKADQQQQSLSTQASIDNVPNHDDIEIEKNQVYKVPIGVDCDTNDKSHAVDSASSDISQKQSGVGCCSSVVNLHVENYVSNCIYLNKTVDRPNIYLKKTSKISTYDLVKHGCTSLNKKLKLHVLSVFNFGFVSFCLSNIFCNAGLGVVVIFLPKYIVTLGISKNDSAVAFTLMGAGMCLGCVAGGLLGNVKCLDRIILYIVGTIGAGLCNLLMISSYFHSVVGIFTLSFLYGLSFGVNFGLLLVLTSDLLSTDALSTGFGYLMFCSGTGLIVGPPIAGILIDISGHLSPAVIFFATLTIIAGIVMGMVPIRVQCCGRKAIQSNK